MVVSKYIGVAGKHALKQFLHFNSTDNKTNVVSIAMFCTSHV